MKRQIITTNEQLELLESFNWKCFAIDTETDGLNHLTLNLLGISLCDGEHNYYIVTRFKGQDNLNARKVLRTIGGFLSDNEIIIAHNMMFDHLVLKKYGLDLSSFNWYDTMVADHLLDENRRHGLKYLTEIYLNKKATEWASDSERNLQDFSEYAMDDTLHTWQIAEIQKHKLKEERLLFLFNKIEMPFLKVLSEMKEKGVLVDQNKLKKDSKVLYDKIREKHKELYDKLGETYSIQYSLVNDEDSIVGNYNFNSSHHLKHILFDKLKLPIVEQTANGTPSTGKITLQKLADKHPFVKTLQEYRVYQKLYNAFYKPLPEQLDDDGRVRANFHDTGTVTGRLSSSRPNLQQLPRQSKSLPVDFRELFIASKGKKLIAIDYSQQELRIMAQLTKDPNLIRLITNGEDQHLVNANAAFNLGIPPEQCQTTHPEYNNIKDKYHTERTNGKVFSFSIPYGAGVNKIAKEFSVSTEQAQKFLEAYFSKFPNLKKTIDMCQEQAIKQGYLTTFVGRRKHFVKDDKGRIDGLNKAFNFLIQSFGADLIRMGCNKIYNYSKKHPEYGISILMLVHDEVVLECNEEYSDVVLKDAIRLLESCVSDKFVVPLKAEGNIGDSYSEAK